MLTGDAGGTEESLNEGNASRNGGDMKECCRGRGETHQDIPAFVSQDSYLPGSASMLERGQGVTKAHLNKGNLSRNEIGRAHV